MIFSEQKNCPKCGALWRDERGYGVNLVGIEDPLVYDGVSWWQCTSCKTVWDRFTGEEVDLAERS